MGALVYTCVTCKRDDVPPQVPIPGFEFTCFTDDEAGDGWNVKPLYMTNDCGRLTARWHKLHPHVHSPDHDYWIWVDGHVSVNNSITSLINEMGDNEIAAFHHRRFYDPYDELEIFKQRPEHHQMNMEAVKLAEARLVEDDYPKCGGMYETGILIMKRCPAVTGLLREWWNLILEYKVPRDQIHFTRIMRKRGIKLYVPSGNVTANDHFVWHPHAHPATDQTQRMLKRWKAKR